MAKTRTGHTSQGTLVNKQSVALAAEGQNPQTVWIAPSQKGKTPRVHKHAFVESYQDNVVRINEQTDPIGFLMAIVEGRPVQATVVNPDGEIVTFYETATLKARLQAAKFLADKVMPRVGVVKVMTDNKDEDKPGATNGRSWDAIVAQAAAGAKLIEGNYAEEIAEDEPDEAGEGASVLEAEPGRGD